MWAGKGRGVANGDKDRNRITIEPAPDSPGEVIDPRDPDAQRRFQIQQRGGTYNDRIRIDPFKRGYVERRIMKRPTRRA